MTGFGESRRQANGLSVVLEIRAINSRYLKISTRTSDGFAAFEPQIETVIREHINRGTVNVALRVDRDSGTSQHVLNENVLLSYRRQLEGLQKSWQVVEPVNLDTLLSLPGVVQDGPGDVNTDELWPLVQDALKEALGMVAEMRRAEGAAMASDLTENIHQIERDLAGVEQRVPLVVERYRGRLTERLNKLLDEFDVTIQPADVVRELGIFAERSDISEEVIRLKSHLEQFCEIMKLDSSVGRRLDFLTQEMFREANTIASKANDTEIARHIVEIKATIERIREMIQNVE